MGDHTGKPAEKEEEFEPPKLTKADMDGDAPPGKHEKPKTK
ncbi:hypothetical protein GCM10017673_18420 [Streptosporangium violaceochromogenes]|nr:hypothetical protein GCM10017673_18420 [Streptosporangium violaceochromogenes]